jgi:hypothetical protein
MRTILRRSTVPVSEYTEISLPIHDQNGELSIRSVTGRWLVGAMDRGVPWHSWDAQLGTLANPSADFSVVQTDEGELIVSVQSHVRCSVSGYKDWMTLLTESRLCASQGAPLYPGEMLARVSLALALKGQKMGEDQR